MAAGNYWMAMYNLEVSPGQLIGPRMVLTLGLGLMFAPISVAAYKYVPAHLRGPGGGSCSAFFARRGAGHVGTSMASTIQERREQFHLAHLDETLNPMNPYVREFLGRTPGMYLLAPQADPARPSLQALQGLERSPQQQAASLAFFDVFWLCAVLARRSLIVLVLMMKRSVAEKGEHLSAESGEWTRRRGSIAQARSGVL